MKLALQIRLCLLLNKMIKRFPFRTQPKTLLLVRLDAIGDYVLFRNFLPLIRQHSLYKDYRITLLGNPAWRDLFEAWDKKYVDEVIWLNRRKFFSNFVYRFRTLWQIRKQGFETLAVSMYSREFLYEESIAEISGSKYKIAPQGNLANILPHEKKMADTFYTQLLPNAHEGLFEFYRNWEFFEQWVGKTERVKCELPILEKNDPKFEIKGKYAVLFAGASWEPRCWKPENFAKIADYLHKNYSLEIVCLGSKNEKWRADLIKKQLDFPIYDFCGQTNLLELAYLIAHAEIVISNDTAAVHFGAASGRKVLCVSNAFTIGRFHPYPAELGAEVFHLYPPEVEAELANFQAIIDKYTLSKKDLDIESVEVGRVIKKLENILS